jgi:glycosyltransferase involved in cell wall biosynthesis
VLKFLRKTPFVFEIRDLWPEVPIQMGVIKNQILIKTLIWLERFIYKKSEHIVAASPGMAEGVKNVSSQKVTVIPNMSKIDRFYPREKNIEFIRKFGLLKDTIKIIHFGTMGEVNGLDNFIEAAILCQKRGVQNIEFILAGSGKKKTEFKKRIINEKINNLHIFDRMPMSDISELVNIADISYVGVSKFKILEINSANKFFDSLSSGKPIILNFGGWMQEIIETEKCGLTVDSVDPNDFLEKIIYLKDNENLRLEMGANSRRLAEERFDKSILCKKYVALIDNVLSDLEKRKN